MKRTVERREGGRLKIAAGAGAGVFFLGLYAATLAPTTLPYDLPELPDAAMLQMQVCVLGITHPTGYPSYLMLTHLFTYLPFGDCAYTVNLASAVYAALAVVAVYWAGLLLARSVIAALVGALAFGAGTTFWSQAVIAEVYTLNALLVTLALGVLLLWRERRRDRYLLLAAFLLGLCLTNHMTSGALLPAALLFVAAVERRKLLERRLLLKGAGFFALGLLPYAYLPLRAAMEPPMSANKPDTPERFWYVVSGGNLRGTFFAFGPGEMPGRMRMYLEHLFENFHWVLVEVGLLGFLALLLWDRAAALLLGVPCAVWLVHALGNNIVDVELYFIPTYLVIALCAARGAALLLSEVQVLLGRLGGAPAGFGAAALSGLLLLASLASLPRAYAANDMSGYYRGREILETVARRVEPGSTVLHHRSNLWYLVLVEERRRDLTLVDPFRHNREVSYADLVWPAEMDLRTTDRVYGTDDPSGLKAARIAAKKGPVYLLAQEEADPRPFREAGWRVVRVKGPLYRLIPQ
ncbi:hypothetical protein Rxycam_00280 [Rubrobacter xylanophilus DSM 9941]|uniref:protein O-mannosyl-transferase family n=1 Tax=Rubrobacter xylanophilus TaxID=49319 RepID=UPI001C63FC27|nr:DUF2723 domain-containing protein [Rubrobacter xylanophilus]QYJ14484.1 hypothetical protein Rxycam_00280 [Rubrobacter xylanophilus DSM 9941]